MFGGFGGYGSVGASIPSLSDDNAPSPYRQVGEARRGKGANRRRGNKRPTPYDRPNTRPEQQRSYANVAGENLPQQQLRRPNPPQPPANSAAVISDLPPGTARTYPQHKEQQLQRQEETAEALRQSGLALRNAQNPLPPRDRPLTRHNDSAVTQGFEKQVRLDATGLVMQTGPVKVIHLLTLK